MPGTEVVSRGHHRPISHSQSNNHRDRADHSRRQPVETPDQTVVLFGQWACRRIASANDEAVWEHLTNMLVEGHALGDLDGVVLRRFFKQCPHERLKLHLREQLGKKALDALLGPAPQRRIDNGRGNKFRGRGREPHERNGNGH